MRIIGLDIGEKRVGVAVSDPSCGVAAPLCVLDATSVLGDGRELVSLVHSYDVGLVVIGLPRSLDGSEGPQAASVRRVGDRVARFLPVPVTYCDEWFSSAEARRSMTAAGVSDRKKRGSVDMVAAALLLQAYLDAQRREEALRNEE